jgi:hypothetical protein
MRTALKDRWVKALRSGKYQQGKSKLRKLATTSIGDTTEPQQEQFCCLGVLCDLVEPKLWEKRHDEWANGSDEDGCGMPREELQRKLGLNKPVTRSDETTTIADKLAEMNDEGKSFKQIANWIEKRKI